MNLTYAVPGIVLFLIGFGVAAWAYNMNNSCATLLGAIGQAINNDNQCQTATIVLPYGIIFGIIGAIVGLVGCSMKEEQEERATPYETNVQESYLSERSDQIFCRFCGKKRQIYKIGEYCPFCGKDAFSLSPGIKSCINCECVTGEDSLFCANCGYQDFRGKNKI